jgi:4-amino-4-deoxy-L-arabinose transferase-like glycosyltransferase
MTKKNNWLAPFFILSLLSIVYFVSRFQNLTSIPVFGDEAIYIRWAQIIKSVETLRFIPLTDGKQPLYMWILAGLLKFISDPLVAGRTISVFAGWGTMLALYLTSTILFSFNKKETNVLTFIFSSIKENIFLGSITALTYIFLPFAFFFDRMALADNLLSFFGISTLFLSLLNAKYKRLDLSMILGAFLGISWLTKSPAIYFIVLSAFTYVIFNLKNYKTFYFPAISSFISLIIYSILRLGPQFHMIALRNRDYVWPIFEVLKHPLDPFKPHITNAFSIYSYYISVPVLLFSLLGLILFIRKNYKNNTKLLSLFTVFCWWFLPLIANASIAKVFTARYILYTLPSMIVLMALGFYTIFQTFGIFKKIPIRILSLTLIFSLNIFYLYKLSIKPFNIKLPHAEIGYITDWTSGWGIKESADYLKNRSLEKNIIVGTEGYFGTLPNGLEIYTNQVKQLTVLGIGLGFVQIPDNLLNAKNHGDEVYILINQSRLKLSNEELAKLSLVESFEKPGNDKLLLYKL